MEQPTTIVLLGITGDLAQKKILPALFSLYAKKKFPEKTRIVGFSRRAFTENEIREFVKASVSGHVSRTVLDTTESKKVSEFLNIVSYVQGDFGELESYRKLGQYIADMDAHVFGGCSNRIFYLSVPPTLYEDIATNISLSGLSVPCGSIGGYSRILIEKPFGKDLVTARKLDQLLTKLFARDQIFHIDHYLAKRSLLSILEDKKTNAASVQKWNNQYVASVEIRLYEKVVVSSRGAFYDAVGALRDVGQNHMLQMLALITLNVPKQKAENSAENTTHGSAKDIQDARAEVLEHLVPFDSTDMTRVKCGQYDGYLSEPGVAPDSTTETFFSLVAYVDIETFAGVPFTLTSGKALSENLTEISITFKDGTKTTLTVPPEDSLPAYQKIILDCIAGDQTIFTSTREILAEWYFITPIITTTEDKKFFIYKKGMDAKNMPDQ